MDSFDDDYEDESVLEDITHKQCLANIERLEDTVEKLNAEVSSLRVERDMVKEQLKSSKFCSEFVDSDEKILFFTGFPSLACFLWLIDYISPRLPNFSALRSKDAFLLTFMKLRLNLLHQDLPYRFQIKPVFH